MKKLTYLFTGLIMVALVVSCSKETTVDMGVDLKDAKIDKQSLPKSVGRITPVILAVDKPRGGNVTCDDVAQAYVTSFDYCGDKRDYDGLKFNGTFPLNVTVEGVFVSFSTDGDKCIQIGDKYYKVGAVIVKGGNKANVYFYKDGTLSDSGLASPINASGSPAALSNLTFCFVECAPTLPEVVIAVKSWYGIITEGVWSNYTYTVSTGTYVYATDWCDILGINYFPTTSSFKLAGEVGSVNIQVGWPNGVRSLIITVDLNDDLTLDQTYLYVGSLAGLGDLSKCPAYTQWPYQDGNDTNTHIFTIPY